MSSVFLWVEYCHQNLLFFPATFYRIEPENKYISHESSEVRFRIFVKPRTIFEVVLSWNCQCTFPCFYCHPHHFPTTAFYASLESILSMSRNNKLRRIFGFKYASPNSDTTCYFRNYFLFYFLEHRVEFFHKHGKKHVLLLKLETCMSCSAGRGHG